nr:hypothetical protein BaRGS_025871 [Batillaria attramentaria]
MSGHNWWQIMNDNYTYGDDEDFDDTVDLEQILASMGQSSQDRDYRQKLMYYLMGIGGLIVCCFGMVANGLSVAVLTRRSMRSSTYTYLASLAICDSLVLVFTALLILKDTKNHESVNSLDRIYNIMFPYVHPTAIIFQVTSIWLTMAFTVDRYIMICHPFKAEHMCRRSRARKVVFALYVAGVIFCIPKFLEYYTLKQELKLMNSTQVVYNIDVTEIGKNEVFREIVHSWLYLICVCGLPFLTMVVLNGFLIHAVRMSRRKGKELNAKEKHRNDTTIMLIGVIIIFLICQGPALVSRMVYAFKPANVAHISRAYFTLNEVANFLVILNSAINIVPYYFFGRKFRSEFWGLFCACLFDKDELRRMTRTMSLSMDPGRRCSTASNNYEMNGLGHKAGTPIYNSGHSLDMPLITSNGRRTSEFERTGSMRGQGQYLTPNVCSAGERLAKSNGHCSYSAITPRPPANSNNRQVMVTLSGNLGTRTGV